MQRRTLSQTDLDVSALCLGTMILGSKVDRVDCFPFLDAYLEAGGNFLDTARIYSDWIPGELHRSERILGEWLKARGNRDELIIATKGGLPEFVDMSHTEFGDWLDLGKVPGDLTASLDHLKTDRVDLYFLHRDHPDVPVDEIMDVVHELVASGKTRYVGCSNWRADRIRTANTYAVEHGKTPFVVNQLFWHVGVWKMDWKPSVLEAMNLEALQFHRETGMTAIAYSPQARGLFSKAVHSEALSGTGSLPSWYSPQLVDLAQALNPIGELTGLTVNQVVLNYLIQHPLAPIPIVGGRTVEQLQDSFKALERPLPKEAYETVLQLAGEPG